MADIGAVPGAERKLGRVPRALRPQGTRCAAAPPEHQALLAHNKAIHAETRCSDSWPQVGKELQASGIRLRRIELRDQMRFRASRRERTSSINAVLTGDLEVFKRIPGQKKAP